LLLESFGELLGALPFRFEQACILDRNCGLIGEALQ
jgi:hypothetical protein